MNHKFNWPQFLRMVAVIAIPIALQNLLTSTGSMVDTMMIATLGETSVAAVGLCAQFQSLLFSCYWGFVGGGMLFFSQYWGAKDEDGIDRSYGVTFICMVTVGAIFAGAALLFPETVMAIYTDKDQIRAIGVQYLSIVGWAYIFQVLSTAMGALLRSTERVRIPLYASIASVATNVILNWILIFGRFGMPVMGVRGAAIATVAAGFVNVAVTLVLAVIIRYPFLFHVRKHFRFTGAFIRLYFQKCFPILANEIAIGVGNMVINIVLGHQIAEAIAATAVLRTLEGLVIGFFAGFSNAGSILVGKCVGAGDHETAYARTPRLIYLCQGVIAVVVITLIILHTPILTAMSLSGESFRYGTGLLIIYCVVAIIRMGNWTMNDTYRSAGDATTGTVLEIVFMYLLVLPAVCLAGFVFHAPFFLIFAFCYIDEPIRYVLMQIHMYSGRWIRPVTPEGKATLAAFFESRKLPRSFYGK